MRHGIECVDARVPAYVMRLFIILHPAINNQMERLHGSVAKGNSVKYFKGGSFLVQHDRIILQPTLFALEIFRVKLFATSFRFT